MRLPRPKRQAGGDLAVDPDRHAQPGAESQLRHLLIVRCGIRGGVLDQLVLPVRIGESRRRVDDLRNRGGVHAAAGVTVHVAAVGHQHRQRHHIVRDHLLGDFGDAIEQLAQLGGVAHRREQVVEQLEIRGPRAQRHVAAGLFGEALMRERERDVIGDAARHQDVVAREVARGARVEIDRGAQPPSTTPAC